MKKLRVLVACEFSGIVRDAFAARGHDAWSCDLLPSERPGNHIQATIETELYRYQDRDDPMKPWSWDLLVAFPPCTYLAVSGARWFKGRQEEQAQALEFVRMLMDAPIPRIAIENPISVISTKIRKPDQIVQPFWFGEPFQKTTCLWLKNLPKLTPTDMVEGREQKCWKEAPSPDRWKNRSRTYLGFARAMAAQWSDLDD